MKFAKHAQCFNGRPDFEPNFTTNMPIEPTDTIESYVKRAYDPTKEILRCGNCNKFIKWVKTKHLFSSQQGTFVAHCYLCNTPLWKRK